MERDRKGWTSEKLADTAKVSHSWVRNFEAGIIQNPGADRLRSLEVALGLRTGELYAASLNVPYDTLVADLLLGQDSRQVPWERLLDGQKAMLEELRALARRVSAGPVDEAAGLAESAAERGIQRGRKRAALPPAKPEAS